MKRRVRPPAAEAIARQLVQTPIRKGRGAWSASYPTPRFPKDVLGFAMTAYFGGRAECRIRRVPVPVVYIDFQSMYPTVCTLMNLWSLMACQRIEVVEGVPEDLQSMVASPTLLKDCFKPGMWRNFVGVAQIEADNVILPVRSHYDATGQTWQIGVNPLTHKEAIWYSIPDVIAAALLTGRTPRILRVIRLIPRGVPTSLCPTALRGVVPVDPRTQDFFKTVIEERIRWKTGRSAPPEIRVQLSAFLKVLGNAGSYGIFAQMDRKELLGDTRERVRVYGFDRPFEVKVSAPEDPGEFSFPPMAACITSGARLMLALLERCVTDAGGIYAFCDTDSMAVVATETGGLVHCPGGPHRLSDRQEAIQALSWEQVENLRERFARLNPYDQEAVPGRPLKLEDENFDMKTSRRRQLSCHATSAKRYALFNMDCNGRPILRKWSEHGLGHLLNPTNPGDSDRDWIRTIWEGSVIEDALGRASHWPEWLVRPAVGRITISSPSLLRLFEHLNHRKSYADQIKPFNFLLTAFVDAFGHPSGTNPEQFQLLAPWTPDPREWLKLDWIDSTLGRNFVFGSGVIQAAMGWRA